MKDGKPDTYKAWNCRERQKGKSGNGCKNRTVQERHLEDEICRQMGWGTFDEVNFDQQVSRVLVNANEIVVERK